MVRAPVEGKMKSELRTVMKHNEAECDEQQVTRDNIPQPQRIVRAEYTGRKVFIRR